MYKGFILSRFLLICLEKKENGLQTMDQSLEKKHPVCPGVVIVKMSGT